MNNILTPTPRIGFVDALRGFAIAAIFLIHTSNHFLYDVFPEYSSLDTWVRDMLYFLFEGKSYTIFALLFGFTFALQMESHRRRTGGDFAGRMLKRLMWLAVFGVFNAAFFAGGDPLVFYALAMLVVVPLRWLSNKALMIIGVILLLQPLDLLNYFTGLWGENYYTPYGKMSEVLSSGELLPTLWANITWGLQGCLLWAFEEGRFAQTLGLFLMGMLCYRVGVFNDTRKWSRHLYYFVVLTCALFLVKTYLFAFAVHYYNLAFALTLVTFVARVYERFPNGWLFDKLSIYGRMSLTNFVAQSIFGAILYYPWALHLGPRMGVGVSVASTVVLIALQVAFSAWWLKSHKRGPLEGLWHRLVGLSSK